MKIRKPIVAGQFYPSQRSSCVEEINECLEAMKPTVPLPETIAAGIVPHAGWTFSGSLAALVFSTVKRRHEKVHTFVIFGAAHGYFGPTPALDSSDFWETPLGNAAVDTNLSEQLVKEKVAVINPQAHKSEHSIEVQVPFIKHLFPEAEILPIIVPPGNEAILLGEGVGNIITSSEKKIVCIGSTDLTHYGPRYGFIPMGMGTEGLEWAAKVNDRMFIDSALKMEPQRMLTSAAENCNACGSGAAAATVAAAKCLGKTKGTLLAYTNSNEVMLQKMGTSSSDSVGYAAIIY
jgi:AmmeMemoRadiSam system protein B